MPALHRLPIAGEWQVACRIYDSHGAYSTVLQPLSVMPLPAVLTSGAVASALERMEALKKESDLQSLLRLAGGVAGALNAQDGGTDGDANRRLLGDVQGGPTESAVRRGLMANIASAIDNPNFGNEMALQAIGTVSQQFDGATSVAASTTLPGRAAPTDQQIADPAVEVTTDEAMDTTLDYATTVVQASVALLGATDVSDGGAAAPLEALGQVLMPRRLAPLLAPSRSTRRPDAIFR